MTNTKQVLGPDDVRRAVTRMAHEIIERNHGIDGVALVGLQRGGVWLAEMLGAEIERIARPVPIGAERAPSWANRPRRPRNSVSHIL